MRRADDTHTTHSTFPQSTDDYSSLCLELYGCCKNISTISSAVERSTAHAQQAASCVGGGVRRLLRAFASSRGCPACTKSRRPRFLRRTCRERHGAISSGVSYVGVSRATPCFRSAIRPPHMCLRWRFRAAPWFLPREGGAVVSLRLSLWGFPAQFP